MHTVHKSYRNTIYSESNYYLQLSHNCLSYSQLPTVLSFIASRLANMLHPPPPSSPHCKLETYFSHVYFLLLVTLQAKGIMQLTVLTGPSCPCHTSKLCKRFSDQIKVYEASTTRNEKDLLPIGIADKSNDNKNACSYSSKCCGPEANLTALNWQWRQIHACTTH